MARMAMTKKSRLDTTLGTQVWVGTEINKFESQNVLYN